MATWISVYMLLVGLLIAGLWCILLVRGRVPELKSAPASIALHLVAELVCAVSLVVAAIWSWRAGSGAMTAAAAALGMLIYTVINSAGYYAQQRAWLPVAMFGVLVVLSVVALAGL
jgi:hypothetical protein